MSEKRLEFLAKREKAQSGQSEHGDRLDRRRDESYMHDVSVMLVSC